MFFLSSFEKTIVLHFFCYFLANNCEDNIFAKGAGTINFVKAMDPGLAYDCSADDYVNFLYGQGFDKELTEIYKYRGASRKSIKPWELNYPSLMVVVPSSETIYSLNIPRRLTYLGTSSSDYMAAVKNETEGDGIKIEVKPNKLHFNCSNRVQQFMVNLKVDKELWKMRALFHASLVWTSKYHSVRSPIVIVREEANMLRPPRGFQF